MSPEIGAAIIAGVIGVGSGAATYLMTSMRAQNSEKGRLSQMARYVGSELSSFIRHCEANMVKIDSLLDRLPDGRRYDYEKFSYSREGLNSLKLKELHALHERVLQDLLRLNLIVRNTEYHVQFLLDCQANPEAVRGSLEEELKLFRKRLYDVAVFAKQISANLTRYARDPSEGNDVNISWPKTFYEVAR